MAPTVSVAEAPRKLCEGYFVFRALGPTKVKGVCATIDGFEVIRSGPLRDHRWDAEAAHVFAA